MSNILQALNESLADEIMAIAKAKGMNPRLRGTPEQERERTQQMLAQRAKDREMNPPQKPTLSPEQVEQLKQSLEQEQKDFDPYYEYSDDHGYWTKQKEKAQRIGRIKQQLKDAGEQLKEQKIYSSVSVLTEARIYKLWENAGHKINEAQLTADQIKDLFSQIEQGATAAGGNRTMLGKGKDAAGAVSKAWNDLKDKIYNSKPMSNFAAAYDKAAEQLKQATGGDEGAMKYIQKYRDFAQKHPVLQSAIYSALIAAAGISSAGLGGAAMLGLLKMVDQAIQGKDIRSAMWSGAKTGAMAYGASKIGDLVKGQGSTSTTTDTTGYSQEYTGQTGDYGQPTYNLKPTGGDMQYVPRPGTIQAGQGAGNTIDWGGEFVPKGGSSVSGTLSGVTSDQITSSPVYKQVFADQMKRFGNAPGASIDAHEVAAAAAEQAMLKGGVKESIELSESQIRLVIGTIAGASNLQEGIGDAFKTFVNTGKQNWSKDIAAVKGVAGKAADWAKTKGHNLTTKVTADKLMQAWKKAGSPTDSLDVASVIQNAGVSSDIIKQVYSSMKIPAPGEAGGGAQGTRDIPVDPSSVAPGPVSTAGGQTPSTPSDQASAPATGGTAGTQGAPAKAAGATSGYQQVKQLLTQLDKRGKMDLVKMLEKELAVTEDILSLTESELQLLAELSPETLASYKKKAGQSASQADKEGNYKLGDKRFSGIVRATKKELDKDVAKHKQDVEEGFMDMFSKKEQSPKGPQILYYVKNPDGTKTYINIKDAEQLADVQKQHQGKDAKTLDLSRQDVLDWLQSRGVNLRKFWPGATITVGGRDAGQNVEEDLDENLHKWFKEKWVRFGPDGKIRGDCARGSDSEGKPKCLPQSKAHSLGKKGRASAAARKRREDPNPERSGKAINVNTKKKTNEAELDEACWKGYHKEGNKKMFGKTYPNCVKNTNEEQEEKCPHCGGPMFSEMIMNEKKDACYYKVKSRYKVWPSAYASGALVKCRKKGASNWGTGGKK